MVLVWVLTTSLISFLYMAGSFFRCITWPEFLNLKAVKGAKCFSTQTKTSTYILKGIEVFVGVEKHLWDIGVKLVVVSAPVTWPRLLNQTEGHFLSSPPRIQSRKTSSLHQFGAEARSLQLRLPFVLVEMSGDEHEGREPRQGYFRIGSNGCLRTLS